MNLYGPVRAAEFEGTAVVALSFAAWPEGSVGPTVHTVDVLPPKATKAEPVTDKLFKTLPHPDRKANVMALRFSPDGSRLLGTGYPSGVAQLWDTKAWTEKARFEVPGGLRNNPDFAIPTPDWKSVLVTQRTRKVVRDDRDGKVSERLQVDGRIDVYDPATGKRIASVPMKDSGPQELHFLPDGKSAVMMLEKSFTVTNRNQSAGTVLFDLATKSMTPLFDDYATPVFTPDGKTAFVTQMKQQPNGTIETSLVKYDVAKKAVVDTLKKDRPDRLVMAPILSPDGKRLVTVSSRMVNRKIEDYALKLFDADTLEERGSLTGTPVLELGVGFDPPKFSPDSKWMYTRLGGQVFAYDVAANKVARTVKLGDASVGRSALSPDGKRMVVVAMPGFDAKLMTRDPDPLDLPQPRLWVIDLTNEKAQPQLHVLPHGSLGGLAISPSGTTLTVGAIGGVHLIDLSVKSLE